MSADRSGRALEHGEIAHRGRHRAPVQVLGIGLVRPAEPHLACPEHLKDGDGAVLRLDHDRRGQLSERGREAHGAEVKGWGSRSHRAENTGSAGPAQTRWFSCSTAVGGLWTFLCARNRVTKSPVAQAADSRATHQASQSTQASVLTTARTLVCQMIGAYQDWPAVSSSSLQVMPGTRRTRSVPVQVLEHDVVEAATAGRSSAVEGSSLPSGA